MLALKIAGIICAVPLGIYVGLRVAGICISWIKYGLNGLKPPKRKD